jgi:hypothetical protein
MGAFCMPAVRLLGAGAQTAACCNAYHRFSCLQCSCRVPAGLCFLLSSYCLHAVLTGPCTVLLPY